MSDPAQHGPPGEEAVEVVDAAGRVVAITSRARMRREGLRHRTVFIAVLDPAGHHLLVHQRSPDKDVWPGRWDVAFGGVVDVGEGRVDAARRELAEESGLAITVGELTDLGEARYADKAVDQLARVYSVRSGGPFTCPDGEVVATAWVARADLDAWVADHATCPDGVAVVLPRLPRPGVPGGGADRARPDPR